MRYSDGTVIRATDTQNRHKMCLEFEANWRAGGGAGGWRVTARP